MHFKFNYNHELYQAIWPGAFLFLFLLMTVSPSAAQNKEKVEELKKDEKGKYIYYEIVNEITAPADSLVDRAHAFFKLKKMSPLTADTIPAGLNDQLMRSGKFIISRTAFVLSHPSGEILYNLVFETRGSKYRFWLTDFQFIPYQRDRYGNFVPSTTKGIPLEKSPGKLNAGEWSDYVSDAGRQSAAFAAGFKEYLSASQQAKPLHKSTSIISTKSW
ncbi:hypothetical protein HDF26_003254 [Pedobacter cryoconitis]|uniref:DUF4468 domain-containing protein n=1 Tax=Pedobacter cryoconitis TaxID=188932 RepID=A0A7W8ZLM7_9SPHI|nr:hypothetical protein [Pedobacter cryoconitis]MBB5636289.1 hypothetical protein [Pedobacter cryoconitis]MBB6272794.1 hypothetical protein [Pedobacter cryoconitis]